MGERCAVFDRAYEAMPNPGFVLEQHQHNMLLKNDYANLSLVPVQPFKSGDFGPVLSAGIDQSIRLHDVGQLGIIISFAAIPRFDDFSGSVKIVCSSSSVLAIG